MKILFNPIFRINVPVCRFYLFPRFYSQDYWTIIFPRNVLPFPESMISIMIRHCMIRCIYKYNWVIFINKKIFYLTIGNVTVFWFVFMYIILLHVIFTTKYARKLKFFRN